MELIAMKRPEQLSKDSPTDELKGSNLLKTFWGSVV